MPPDPSVTLDIETATTLRSWLRSVSQRDSLEPAVADPLVALRAAIDSQLHGQAESAPLELSVSTTTVPSNSPSHSRSETRSPSADESTDEDRPAGRADEASPAEPCDTAPSQVYDDLPAQAWHASPARADASLETDPVETDDHDSMSPAGPGGDTSASGAAPPSQFVTAYECDVCGVVREMETSIKVCAYVADCPMCGAADVRFSAITIPTPLQDDSRHGCHG